MVAIINYPYNQGNIGESFTIPNTNYTLTFDQTLTISTHPTHLIHDINVEKYARLISSKILDYVENDSQNNIVYLSSPELFLPIAHNECEQFTSHNLNFRYIEAVNDEGMIMARIDIIFGKTVIPINVSKKYAVYDDMEEK